MSYKPYGRTSRTESITLVPPTGYQWLVQQIAVTSTSTTSTAARVYIGSAFACGSSSGNEDSADGNPLPVRNGSTLTVKWTGGSNAAQYTVTAYVTETPI